MKNYCFFTILYIAFLSSGCATLFQGAKQPVAINSEPNNAKVIINEEPQGFTPLSVKLKRNEKSTVLLEKEGYKSYKEILYPKSFNALSLMSCCFPPFFLVDYISSAYIALSKKELSPKLVKIPDSVSSSATVRCESVRFSPDIDKVLGNEYVNGDQKGKLYLEEEDVDTKMDYLCNIINKNTRVLGYDVADVYDATFSANMVSHYFLNATIEAVKLEVYHNVARGTYDEVIKVDGVLQVQWAIRDKMEDTVYTTTTNGTSTMFQEEASAVLNDAFENAFYAFLNSPEVAELLREPPHLTKHDFELIELPTQIAVKAGAADALDKSMECVVTVLVGNKHGSGYIAGSDGHIITNYHVVKGRDSVKVMFSNGSTLPATVRRRAPADDLVLLKVERRGLPSLTLIEDKGDIPVGSEVFTIGTPGDINLGQTLNKGIISGMREYENKRYIQTDVSINPGSSGGILITPEGRLLGIVNAQLVDMRSEGLSFAVPVYDVFDALGLSY